MLFWGDILTSARAMVLHRSLYGAHLAANYNMHKAAVTFQFRLRNRIKVQCVRKVAVHL
jgi:hypothetical protein